MEQWMYHFLQDKVGPVLHSSNQNIINLWKFALEICDQKYCTWAMVLWVGEPRMDAWFPTNIYQMVWNIINQKMVTD